MIPPIERGGVRRVWVGIGLALLIILFAGNLLARRVVFFSPQNVTFQPDDALVLTETTADGLAAFGQTLDFTGEIRAHALLSAAESVTVSGRVQAGLTALAPEVFFDGQVDGDALFIGETVWLEGEVTGETIVFAETVAVRGQTAGKLTVCAEEVTVAQGVELTPCDREAAASTLRRASGQLAGLWLVSAITRPGLLMGVRSVLPLPVGLLLAASGALAVATFPAHVNRMSVAARVYPGRMLLTGVLITLMIIGLTAGLLLLLAYATLLGVVVLPLYLLLLSGYLLMMAGGWLLAALFVGGWLARRLTTSMIPPVVAAAGGGALLALLALLLGMLPLGEVVRLLFFFGIGLAGAGAAYSTRFGWRAVWGPART